MRIVKYLKFFYKHILYKIIGLKFSCFILLLMTLNLGCSNQWRHSNIEFDTNEVLDFLETIETSGSGGQQSTSLSSQFFALKNDPNARIYYAEGPGEMGTVQNVFSFFNYDFMGEDMQYLTPETLQMIKVVFLHSIESGLSALMVYAQIQDGGNQNTIIKYFSSSNPTTIENGRFTAELQNETGYSFYFHSYDVYKKTNNLKEVIQLRLTEVTPEGDEIYYGKFPTLIELF
ncbi:MAG: hypothetical protein K1X29_10355 [Bdellovibrionales bacterium]|nr:hypothetical protein [Bdellovibrionales bacterium]